MKKQYIKYISSLLLFGSNGIVASFVHLSSYEIVALRTLLGSVLLIAIFLLTGNKFTFFRHKKAFLMLVLSGIAMGSSWIFLYEAYRQIGVSIASLCYYCGPVIVVALSPLLFKEKITLPKLSGFFLVIIGIISVNSNAFNENSNRFGIFCALMSAFMYSAMVIFNKKCKDIGSFENSTIQLTISCITAGMFVLYRQGISLHIPSGSIIPMIFLGLLNTGIGCYLYFSSIGYLRVQTVAICGYLEPLSAVIFSVIFLNETMLPIQIVGAIFVIGGAVISNISFKKISDVDGNYQIKK